MKFMGIRAARVPFARFAHSLYEGFNLSLLDVAMRVVENNLQLRDKGYLNAHCYAEALQIIESDRNLLGHLRSQIEDQENYERITADRDVLDALVRRFDANVCYSPTLPSPQI